MRKFLALGSLALLGAFLIVNTSGAGSQPFEQRVTWRTSANTAQGYVDSSLACHAVSTAFADTTAPIYIGDWVLPEQTVTLTASDSVAWMLLHLYPQVTSGVTAGSDTIRLAVQVSSDAVTWINVRPPLNGGDMLNMIGVGGAADTNFVCAVAVGAEDFPGTTNQHRFRWRTVSGGATAGGWNWQTAGLFPNYLQIFGNRFVRFIAASSDANGCWVGIVRGYKSI